MKFNKILILVIALIILTIFIWNNNSNNLYTSINGMMIANEKEDRSRDGELEVDISHIALGITDNIDNESIKMVASDIERFEVFDHLTLEELTAKLNRSLDGVLSGKGHLIATKALDLGIDPYLATAIMLHETGCSYNCSFLATNYYNVGGMKGINGYQKFSSIDEGINTFLNNLYGNYYKQGLNTPEKINTKYAASTAWSVKIKQYMKAIENK